MKTLVQLAGCEKYYRLSQLNLLDAGSKRTKLFNRAVKYLVTDLIYANSPKMEKLSKAGHRAKGLPYHENVRFVMI